MGNATVSSEVRPRMPARMASGWRVVSLLTGVVIGAVALALIVVSLPLEFSTICPQAASSCAPSSLTAHTARALQPLGISLRAYAIFSTALSAVSSLLWFGVGALVLWRRTDDRVAFLVGLQCIAQSASDTAACFADQSSVWYLLAIAVGAVSQITLFYMFAVFPSGQFAPRWLRWVGIAWIGLVLIGLVPAFEQVSLPSFLGVMVLLFASQIYRYRRVSDAVQRQQTKLVVFAFSIIVGVTVATLVPAIFVPAMLDPNSLYNVLAGVLDTIVLMLGPIAIGVAVLRYRLFDIDVLINRALVYGSLTAVLAAVYFGCVVAMQAVATHLSGETSLPPPAVVATTLLIAALFTPLRRRIQSTIDHRFYRSKYDAARTLAAFGQALRNEMDLPRLNVHLLAAIEETMQPAHVSLWLREHDVVEARRPSQRGAE